MTAINEKKVIFPNNEDDSNEEKSKFADFKSSVQEFFPNLSGVTAEAYYKDDVLTKMTVNITTQFYGASEIIAFTQFVADKTNLLPSGIPIEISINSMQGMEAFLSREPNSNEFKYHVFD